MTISHVSFTATHWNPELYALIRSLFLQSVNCFELRFVSLKFLFNIIKNINLQYDSTMYNVHTHKYY